MCFDISLFSISSTYAGRLNWYVRKQVRTNIGWLIKYIRNYFFIHQTRIDFQKICRQEILVATHSLIQKKYIHVCFFRFKFNCAHYQLDAFLYFSRFLDKSGTQFGRNLELQLASSIIIVILKIIFLLHVFSITVSTYTLICI